MIISNDIRNVLGTPPINHPEKKSTTTNSTLQKETKENVVRKPVSE
jgi:hypothetical protein